MSTQDINTMLGQLNTLTIAESSVTRSPTTFADIPTEVVEKISEHLEAADFLSFRQSGRKAWTGSWDTFVRKFFTKKRILWTEHAFSAFKDMADDERLFRKFEHVVFVMPPRLRLLEDSEMQQAFTIQKTSGQRLNVTDYEKYAGTHDDFLSLHSIDCLIVAFQALRTMAFSLVSLGSQALFAISKVLRVPKRNEAPFCFAEDMEESVLRAASFVQLRLKSLDFGFQCKHHSMLDFMYGQQFDRYRGLAYCLDTLDTLRVDLDSRLNPGDKKQLERGYTRFLSACPRMKAFHLSTPMEVRNEYGIYFLDKTLPLLRFPHLEFLCIEGGICGARTLCKILETHSHTLERFELSHLYMADGTSERVMDELARLPRLRSFVFRRLTTQHGDNLEWCAIQVPQSSLLVERLTEAWTTARTDKLEGDEGDKEDFIQVGRVSLRLKETDGASLSLEEGDSGQMQVVIATNDQRTERVDIPETHRASWGVSIGAVVNLVSACLAFRSLRAEE